MGLGEDDSWKNLKQKISWHCPFNLTLALLGRWPGTLPWHDEGDSDNPNPNLEKVKDLVLTLTFT